MKELLLVPLTSERNEACPKSPGSFGAKAGRGLRPSVSWSQCSSWLPAQRFSMVPLRAGGGKGSPTQACLLQIWGLSPSALPSEPRVLCCGLPDSIIWKNDNSGHFFFLDNLFLHPGCLGPLFQKAHCGWPQGVRGGPGLQTGSVLSSRAAPASWIPTTARSVGPDFSFPPRLPANSFLVLLLGGLPMTEVLVLTALLVLPTCRTLASGAWAGLGAHGAGGGFSPGRAGQSHRRSQGSCRWHYISFSLHPVFTMSVSSCSFGCYKLPFSLTFKGMPWGHVHPQ